MYRKSSGATDASDTLCLAVPISEMLCPPVGAPREPYLATRVCDAWPMGIKRLV